MGTDLSKAAIELDLSGYVHSTTGKLELDKASNALGWNLRLNRIDKASAAVSNPSKILTDRKAAMVAAKTKAETEYWSVYRKLLASGFPDPIARERALKVAAAISEVEDQFIEEDFPADIASTIFGSQSKQAHLDIHKNMSLMS